MIILKKIFFYLSCFLVIHFLFFWIISVKLYDNFEEYFYNLENIPSSNRFGDLNGKRVLHSDYIQSPRTLNTTEWILECNINNALELITNGSADSYLGITSEIEKVIIQKKKGNFRILGRNAYQKGYAFLVKKDSNIYLNDKSVSITKRFIFWLASVLKGNFGFTNNKVNLIKSELIFALPYTISLIILTIIVIALCSLLFSFYLAYNKSAFQKFMSSILEFLSSIPEFIIGFGLLFLFIFNHFKSLDFLRFYREFNFIKPEIEFSFSFAFILNFFKFFSLPVIALSFSNGNISVLTKYLLNRLSSFDESESKIFFTVNGMKQFYLKYIFSLKEILPTIISYVMMKIPLIIGAAVIIEKIFDIHGVGNLAFEYFKQRDVGMILIIIMVTSLIAIITNGICQILNYFINPILRKENV